MLRKRLIAAMEPSWQAAARRQHDRAAANVTLPSHLHLHRPSQSSFTWLDIHSTPVTSLQDAQAQRAAATKGALAVAQRAVRLLPRREPNHRPLHLLPLLWAAALGCLPPLAHLQCAVGEEAVRFCSIHALGRSQCNATSWQVPQQAKAVCRNLSTTPPQPVKPPLTSSPASCSRRKVTALACRSYPANTRSRSSAREEKQANEWSEGKQLQCLGVQVQAVAGKQAQQVLCKGRNKGARCFQI